MSIFNNLAENIGFKKPDYGRIHSQLPDFNAKPTQARIKKIEDRVDAPITGLSAAGTASQEAAGQSFEEQTQRAQSANASNSASNAANLGIFGGSSSGAMERGQRLAGQQSADIAQSQAGEQSRTMAGLGAQDIGNQQQFQDQGLMQLPSMQQGLESAKVNAGLQKGQLDVQKQRTNLQIGLQERAAQKKALGGFGSMFGPVGEALTLFG